MGKLRKTFKKPMILPKKNNLAPKKIKQTTLNLIKNRLTNDPNLFQVGFALVSGSFIFIKFERLRQAIREHLNLTSIQIQELLLSYGIEIKKEKFLYCVVPIDLILTNNDKFSQCEVKINDLLQKKKIK